MPQFLQDPVFWTGVVEVVIAIAPSAVAIVSAIRNSIQSKSLNDATSSIVKKMDEKVGKAEMEKMEYRKIIEQQQEQIDDLKKIAKRALDKIDEGR